MAPEACCATCQTTFEEEGALEMGASFLDVDGKRNWFCCPHCEAEFRAGRRGGVAGKG